MAKLSSGGRKEIGRVIMEQDTPDDKQISWKRTIYAFMTDGVILKKNDVTFRPDFTHTKGFNHTWGWKKSGKMKDKSTENIRRFIQNYRGLPGYTLTTKINEV